MLCASGVVSAADVAGLHALRDAAFGLGHAPLASLARAVEPFLARKPLSLAFEAVSYTHLTLPTKA